MIKMLHTATHCDALQHTATHCNTLQHTATHSQSQYNVACGVGRAGEGRGGGGLDARRGKEKIQRAREKVWWECGEGRIN